MSPKRILIVEDDNLARDGLAELLREESHDVATAATGESGVTQYKSRRPDVVLLDYRLPGMNGLQVLTMIKGHDPTAKIVLMSASADLIDGELCGPELEARKAGASDYITKPLELDELFACLARIEG